MKTINEMVGEKLRESREAKGYSLRDVERLTNKSYSVIGKYENGERAIKVEDLELLCDLYGVSYVEIMQEVFYRRKFNK